MRAALRATRQRLGKNVQQLRHLRGWSQEKLGELSGQTTKIIGQVERGQTNITIDILTDIARGLSVNVADLFRPAANDRSGERVYLIFERDLEQAIAMGRMALRVKRAARRRDRP